MHSDTYIDPSLPLSLARVSQVTGNRMLDVAHLCCDAEPWFSWKSADGTVVYTTAPSSRYQTGSEAILYKMNTNASGTVRMDYLGAGTVSSSGTVTLSGKEYASTGLHEELERGKINMWSKRKPYRLPVERDKPSYITEEDMKAVMYGLTVTSHDSPDEVIAARWRYDAPAVDDGRWKRLTDFSGYDTEAPAPLFAPQKTYYYNEIAEDRRDFYVGYNLGGTEGLELQLSDLLEDKDGNPTELAGMYFGVLLDNSGAWLKATSSKTIAGLVAEGAGGLSLPCPSLPSIGIGSRQAYFVACRYSSAGVWVNAQVSQGAYMPLPFGDPDDAEFTLIKENAYVYIIAYIKASQTTMRATGIEIHVTGANVPDGGAVVTIPAVRVFAESDGSTRVTIDVGKTISVPSGSSGQVVEVPCDIGIKYGDSVDFPGASSSLPDMTSFENSGGINWI